MKKLMKVAIIAVILMMTMVAGITAYAEEGEAPDALMEELIEEGFIQNKRNENLWAFADYATNDDGEFMTIYAVYDYETNYIVIHAYGEWTEFGEVYHSLIYVGQWNYELDEFEVLLGCET